MSKTCATCKHRVPMSTMFFACKISRYDLPEGMVNTLGCEAHEEKREPMRLECECTVDDFRDTYVVNTGTDLTRLAGKKFKMTLVEVIDE